MKTPAFVILGMLFFATHASQAQSPVVFKYKNNPTYSIHNYKQPEKAALARKYKLNPTVTLDYIPALPAANKAKRNYKAQAPTAQKQISGGVVPSTTRKKQVNSIHSSANYKRQFK